MAAQQIGQIKTNNAALASATTSTLEAAPGTSFRIVLISAQVNAGDGVAKPDIRDGAGTVILGPVLAAGGITAFGTRNDPVGACAVNQTLVLNQAGVGASNCTVTYYIQKVV